MADAEVKHIVIAGGTAAVVAAAATAISLRGSEIKITLIQLPDDEKTTPIEVSRGGPQSFHHLLGIDEQTLMKRTGGAFALGTRYRGFRSENENVFVPLGSHGVTLRLVDFHHYAAKLRIEGSNQDYNAYSLPAAAAAAARFVPPGDTEDPVQKTVEYDICIGRDRYLLFMLDLAVELGVTVMLEAIKTVDFGKDGIVDAVVLANGHRIDGDFFIDCSDGRTLIGRLSTANDFQDWSSWLPCDRIASVQLKSLAQPDLFASIDAHDNGWVQRIMLSDVGFGSFAYSSQYADDDFAKRFFEQNEVGAAVSDVNVATQRAGCYEAHWVRNCVALGRAALVLEPMEISSMHLLQSSILRLLTMLPRRKTSVMLSTEFNRATNEEAASARDYQILRYALAARRTGPFWEGSGQTPNPDSLQNRISLFKTHGRLTGRNHDFISKARWVSSFINFGFWPSSYDPLADMVNEQRMRNDVSQFRDAVQRAAEY